MLQAIIQQRLEQTLAGYVSMPTVTNDIETCAAAVQSIAAEYQQLGLTVHTDGPNHPWLIATSTPEAMVARQVKVLFVIHFDVVPFANESQRELRVAGGKLYGRGVYDMKFAAAAVKEMLVDFSKEGNLSDFDFGVLITTDEEKGGHDGSLEFLKKGWRCEIAVVPDGGYNWTVEKRAKGLIHAHVTMYGRPAHSSRPWLADNPISKLAPAVTEITAGFPNTNHDGAVTSINSISSSNSAFTHTTQIAQWAQASLTIRAFTAQEAESALGTVEAIAKKHGAVVDITINEPGIQLKQGDPLVQAFIRTASEIQGEPVGFSDAYAASDARHFDAFGIPTVQLYPHGGDHHGPNEWILQGDLFKYYLLCKQFVEQTAQPQGLVNSTQTTNVR